MGREPDRVSLAAEPLAVGLKAQACWGQIGPGRFRMLGQVRSVAAQPSRIEPLTGSNFPTWKYQLMMGLALADLDYALRVDEPTTPEADVEHYEAKRAEYLANSEKWERSNRLARQIMRNSISECIRGAITDNENAKKYLASVEEHYKRSSKFHATTFIQRLTNARYDGSKGNVRDHIMQIIDLNAQLR